MLRQSPRSAITRAAAAISDGDRPAPGRLVDGSEFELRLTAGASATAARIVELVRDELPALYDVDPMHEILVLADGRELHRVAEERQMASAVPGAGRQPIRATAEDGRRLILPAAKAMRRLIPAFALTAHKSQGLEVPVVVIAMHAEATHPALLSRSLLYTAITRASRAVVLITDDATLETVIANQSGGVRGRTALGRRIVAINQTLASVQSLRRLPFRPAGRRGKQRC